MELLSAHNRRVCRTGFAHADVAAPLFCQLQYVRNMTLTFSRCWPRRLFEACTYACVVCRFRDRRLMGRLMVWLCLRCCFPGKKQAGSRTRLAPFVLVKLLGPSTMGSVANSGTGSRSDQNRPGQRPGRTALWTSTRTTHPARFRAGTLVPQMHHAQDGHCASGYGIQALHTMDRARCVRWPRVHPISRIDAWVPPGFAFGLLTSILQ